MTALRVVADVPRAPQRRHAPVPAAPLLAELRLLIQSAGALVLANTRYWRTVAPVVEHELRHWRERAAAIVDPELRKLALSKLDGERFNAEAGAMLATFAPPAHRGEAARAIVALQLLFDLLDGLNERPSADPILDGERLFEVLTDALRIPSQVYPTPCLPSGDYLHELSSTARSELARLPAIGEVIGVAQASAERAAQAQIRMHAAPLLGTEQLRAWAQEQTRDTHLQWRELAAGAASSVLAVHALLAAAGDPATSTAEASAIDRAYLSICVLLTLLDGLTDHDADTQAGQLGYVSLYEDSELLGQALRATCELAIRQARELPHAAEHRMILTAVVAYYASAPGARGQLARPHVARLRGDLQPLISPALLVMRAWRLARRLKGRS
jgi:tetraprenyl-beta-curcumene synthase